MRKLFALLATLGLLAALPATGLAGHKEGHNVPPGAAKNAPPPKDCGVEVDVLGICVL